MEVESLNKNRQNPLFSIKLQINGSANFRNATTLRFFELRRLPTIMFQPPGILSQPIWEQNTIKIDLIDVTVYPLCESFLKTRMTKNLS